MLTEYSYLRYTCGFFRIVIAAFVGVAFYDAFFGGKNFMKEWLIIIVVVLPLYIVLSICIERLEKKEGIKWK